MLVGCGKRVVVSEYAIIPAPVSLSMDKGTFTLSRSTKCYVGNVGQNDQSVKYISNKLRQWRFNPVLVGMPEDDCLQFIVNENYDPTLGDEGYSLVVDKNGLVVTANNERGLFYGFQTFTQMLPEDIGSVRYSRIVMPACQVRDYPRFAWRGSHLDVSRHFFGVSQVKKQLDLMALYKMNKFHWHLTDDHGWRIESERYPQLNDVGSWRVNRDDQPWGEADPAVEGEARSNGGYYTREEIEEIVAYAAERYIDVIPEIDFPGHCCAILESYPALACAGDDTSYTVQFGPYWPPRAILCGGNDSVMAFLKDVMDEIIPLFPCQYIHIGGDEAVKDNWKRCPRCQDRIKNLGLPGEAGLQSWMMCEIERYVSGKGKKVIGWDEILEGGVSANATVMAWQGAEGGIVAARHGNDVIMTPTEFCYLNYYQAASAFQPPAMPNTLVTLRKVYQFDPMPQGLTESQRHHILGGQANLWSEYINTPEQLEYMLLPRLCAMAEVLWTPVEVKSWPDFKHRVALHRLRLAANDYEIGSGSFAPVMESEKQDNGLVRISFDCEVEGTKLYINIDSAGYQIYKKPIMVPSGSHVSTLSFYCGRIQEKEYQFVVK